MRKLFNFTYCILLLGQILADHNNAILGERNRSLDLLGQRNMRNDIHNKSSMATKNFTTLPRITSTAFSQSLTTYILNFEAFCLGKKYEAGLTIWEFSFVQASCDPTWKNPGRIKVKCNAWWYYPTGPARRYSDGIHDFHENCPERTVCQPTIFTENGRSQYGVACVDDEDVTTEQVTPADSHADPNTPNVHCGTSLEIPGSVFTVKPGIQSIDVTLTEEARFQDGSPYPAPMLYIRDKTSRWRGFDRVFRRDASVASARITLSAVGGKFQTRVFEFCMQLSPEIKAGAVTFTYSWFQTTSRHGRVAGQPLLN